MDAKAWEAKYQALMAKRPPECTRRRLKPFIDGCECNWCRKLDAHIAERPRPGTQTT